MAGFFHGSATFITQIVRRFSGSKDGVRRGCEIAPLNTGDKAAAAVWLMASSISDRNSAATGLELTNLGFLVMQACITKYHYVLFSSNILFQSIP